VICTCGSGLTAKRTTVYGSASYKYVCAKCRILTPVVRKNSGTDQSTAQDRRNAQARRRLEEMREMGE
jgi:ribosome-binding protein aMBF1 (putative translation factor)